MSDLPSREEERQIQVDAEWWWREQRGPKVLIGNYKHNSGRLQSALDAIRAALGMPESSVEEMIKALELLNEGVGAIRKLKDEEITRLRQQLARYSNPWTSEAQNQLTRHWTDVTHDAPLTMAEAETRLAEHKAESPEAKFRVVPWFSPSQREHINKLTAEAWNRANS